jgi:CheY-like chemotaxis protein
MAGSGCNSAGQRWTLRVLVVEDDPTDRLLIARGFRDPAPLPGPVELEAVGDVDAALAVLAGRSFAVILSDYSLPGWTGLDLLRRLRERDDRTPLVLMSGGADEALAATAKQLGAVDCIVKRAGFERALPALVGRVLAA